MASSNGLRIFFVGVSALVILTCTSYLYKNHAGFIPGAQIIIPNGPTHVDQSKIHACHASNIMSQRLKIVDLNRSTSLEGECIKSKTSPAYTLCIHDPKVDKDISRRFKNEGSWEMGLISRIQTIFRADPQLGFIDIGANIGTWGLFIATIGQKTLLVEPFPSHVEKLIRSIQIGNLQDKVTLVQNSVSDKYEDYTAYFPFGSSNLGALRMVPYNGTGEKMSSIFMDDLLPLLAFNRAVMKMDLEGFEDKALAHSDLIFKHVFIPYIVMEWVFPILIYGNDKNRVTAMIDNLTGKGYRPYSYGGSLLELNKWRKWPNDIMWCHNLIKMKV